MRMIPRYPIQLLISTLLAASSLCVAQNTPSNAPSRDELEKRIASFPADQQALERFRFWAAGLPDSERPGPARGSRAPQDALFAKFDAWLRSVGFSAPEAERQVALVKKRGSAGDAEFWNSYLVNNRATWLNSSPNAFLVEMLKGRHPGRALDVAMGEGRNTIWLAQQGWDAFGFDPADQAIASARKNAQQLRLTIHTEITTMEEFDFGENQWDLILLSYAGCSEIAAKVEKALKPGGILVVEAFHTDALKTLRIGGSLCKPAELPNAFQGLRVLHYDEPIAKPDFAPTPARIVRFAAEKPLP